MKVFVAGASGALGLAIVRALRASGHEVIGLTRGQEGAAALARTGAQPVVADALDRKALIDALAGLQADAVLHELTALKKAPMRHGDMEATNVLREQGTADLVEAARQLGARRMVTQSMMFGYGFYDHGERLLTEEDPFGQFGQGAFDRHVAAMRSAEEQTFGAEGIEGVALRYALLYGSDPSTTAMVELLRRRRLPAVCGRNRLSWLSIDDAATATVAALERGRPGQAYNLADDRPVTWVELLGELAAAFGAPQPRRIPGWLLRPMPYAHRVMTIGLGISNARARAELGWAPAAPTIHEGIARLAPARAA